nr:hypothetical protein [Tanacetum cinerariifolium]
SAKKELPYEIEVVYKNGAKEVRCRKFLEVVYDWKPPRKESTKVVGEEQKNYMNPKPCANDKSDGKGFIDVQNKRNVGIKENVLRPNFKPNN